MFYDQRRIDEEKASAQGDYEKSPTHAAFETAMQIAESSECDPWGWAGNFSYDFPWEAARVAARKVYEQDEVTLTGFVDWENGKDDFVRDAEPAFAAAQEAWENALEVWANLDRDAAEKLSVESLKMLKEELDDFMVTVNSRLVELEGAGDDGLQRAGASQ